jgi:hypothetical protein
MLGHGCEYALANALCLDHEMQRVALLEHYLRDRVLVDNRARCFGFSNE